MLGWDRLCSQPACSLCELAIQQCDSYAFIATTHTRCGGPGKDEFSQCARSFLCASSGRPHAALLRRSQATLMPPA